MYEIDDGIWLTGGLLNPYECASLIAKAKVTGFCKAHLQKMGRHNSEAFLESSETLNNLLVLLRRDVAQEKSVGFRIVGLEEVLECYRYREGEFITAHYDAPAEIEPGICSTFTLVVYLSDDFEGGETVFPAKGIKVRPHRGQAVLFKHSILHEAATVISGTKYIARTSVVVSD